MRRGRRNPVNSPDTRIQQRLNKVEGSPEAWRGDTGWHNVGAAGEPAFLNGWANLNPGVLGPPTRFRRDQSGTVFIDIYITGGAAGANVFTIPAGYRPDAASGQLVFPAYTAGANWYIVAFSNGTIQAGSQNVAYQVSFSYKAGQ